MRIGAVGADEPRRAPASPASRRRLAGDDRRRWPPRSPRPRSARRPRRSATRGRAAGAGVDDVVQPLAAAPPGAALRARCREAKPACSRSAPRGRRAGRGPAPASRRRARRRRWRCRRRGSSARRSPGGGELRRDRGRRRTPSRSRRGRARRRPGRSGGAVERDHLPGPAGPDDDPDRPVVVEHEADVAVVPERRARPRPSGPQPPGPPAVLSAVPTRRARPAGRHCRGHARGQSCFELRVGPEPVARVADVREGPVRRFGPRRAERGRVGDEQVRVAAPHAPSSARRASGAARGGLARAGARAEARSSTTRRRALSEP